MSERPKPIKVGKITYHGGDCPPKELGDWLPPRYIGRPSMSKNETTWPSQLWPESPFLAKNEDKPKKPMLPPSPALIAFIAKNSTTMVPVAMPELEANDGKRAIAPVIPDESDERMTESYRGEFDANHPDGDDWWETHQ